METLNGYQSKGNKIHDDGGVLFTHADSGGQDGCCDEALPPFTVVLLSNCQVFGRVVSALNRCSLCKLKIDGWKSLSTVDIW